MISLFISSLLVLGTIFMIALMFSGIALYVLHSMALYDLAKNNGYENNKILAWIPVARLYLLSIMSGDILLFKKYKLESTTVGILLVVLSLVTATTPILNFFTGVALFVLLFYVYESLYKKIDAEKSSMMSILSVLIPIIATVYLFMKKDVLLTEYEVVNI